MEKSRCYLTKHLLCGHFDRTFIAAPLEEGLLVTASCLAVAKARVRTMKVSLNTTTFILVINLMIITIFKGLY